jgi:microcompartment protein CcmK/EutM
LVNQGVGKVIGNVVCQKEDSSFNHNRAGLIALMDEKDKERNKLFHNTCWSALLVID